MTAAGPTTSELADAFPCFGGRAAVLAMGAGDLRPALRAARRRLEAWHTRLTRFDATSELSLMNAAPTSRVRVSDVMCLFVVAALDAARRSGGLVDPTLVGEVDSAGYVGDLDDPVPLGDRYMHPSLADISVPFASGYKAGWTTAGIAAGWALAGLGLSYYARRWTGPPLAQAAPLHGARVGARAAARTVTHR